MIQSTEAIWIKSAGGPGQLKLKTMDLAPLGQDEVLVEMEAAGVAFADIMMREGRYPGVRPPVTPGYDVIGRVVAVGTHVRGFEIGERVGGLTISGSYARHRTLKADRIVKAPRDADPAELVALILNYCTAWQMLRRCLQLEKGDWVIVHGAAGGVGQALLQLCRHFGVQAIGTASRGKHEIVSDLGAYPVDYASEKFEEVAKALTEGKGVSAVFDHIGGSHVLRSYSTLAPWGTVITYGAMAAFSGGRFNVLKSLRAGMLGSAVRPMKMLTDNRAVVGFDISGRFKARPEFLLADLKQLFDLYLAGQLQPKLHDRLPLADAEAAHKQLGESSFTGKLVLVP